MPQSVSADDLFGAVNADDLFAAPTQKQAVKPKSPGAMDYLKAAGQGLMDPFIGAAKGAGSTLYNLTDLTNKGIRAIPGADQYVPPMPPKPDLFSPEGPVQKIGYGAEQMAEFLAPEGLVSKGASAIEKGLSGAPAIVRGAASLIPAAVSAGAVNKAQGGDFGTGAAVGYGAGALGKIGEAIAPSIAESAMGISRRFRMHGKTPGAAILEETTGISPGKISEQAGAAAQALTSQLESAAAQSTTPASVKAATDVVDDALSKAQAQNSKGLFDKLTKVREQLTHDQFTQQVFPAQRTATDILNAKRGINDLISSWTVDERKGVQKVLPRVYGALDKELDRVVPGAADLNQRISSLIPAKIRAKVTDESAMLAQRVMGRFAKHTGALVGAGVGADMGYRRGGTAGAVVGGMAGLIAPEMLASPTGQMTIARGLNSGVISKLPLALPATRLLHPDAPEVKPSDLFAP